MDIIKEHRKHIRYACFFFIALFALIAFIIMLTKSSDFSELRDAIKEMENSKYVNKEALAALKKSYTKVIIPYAFECVFLIIGALIAALGLYKTHKDGSYKVTAVLAGLAGAALAIPVAIFAGDAVKQIKDAAEAMGGFTSEIKIEIPGELNAILALSIIGAIFCVISAMVPTDYNLVLKGTGALGYFSLFVSTCIALDQLGSAEGVNKEKAVAGMILGACLIGMILSGTNDEITGLRKPVVTYQTPVQTQPSVQAQPAQPKVDPQAELQKLKSMLDSGLITEEEYNEKRKKYIDLI